MEIIAHRGDNMRFPENSMLAFQSAYDRGIFAIETDLQLTYDGKVVLFHDFDLKRLLGDATKLIDIESNDLEQLFSNASGKGKHVASAPVYLEDFMRWSFEHDVFLVCELKVKVLEEADLILKQFYKLHEQYPIRHAISSYSDFVVQSKFFESSKSHFIFNNIQPLDQFPKDIKGVCLYADYYSESVVDDLISRNLKLYTWGISTEEQFTWFKKLPMSGLIIDDLSWCVAKG